MAVPQHADVSDDDFDIIEPAQPVSEPCSPDYRHAAAQPRHASDNSNSDTRQFSEAPNSPDRAPLETNAGTEQTGDSRQPQSLPVRPPQPTVHDMTDEDALAPLPSWGDDEGRALASNYHHVADRPRSSDGGGDGIPALKYTKSVYQKLWGGKEALIAVMG